MALLSALPLAEAAAFTIGCMVLEARRREAEKTSVVLVALAAILVLVLVVVSTPFGAPDAVGVDPDEVHSILE